MIETPDPNANIKVILGIAACVIAGAIIVIFGRRKK